MISNEIEKILNDTQKIKDFNEDVKRILSAIHLGNIFDFSKQLFKAADYDKYFDLVEEFKPKAPPVLIGHISGLNEYISKLDCIVKKCCAPSAAQKLLNEAMEDNNHRFRQEFTDKIFNLIDTLLLKKGVVYTMCILSTHNTSFEFDTYHIAGLLEILWRTIGDFKAQTHEIQCDLRERHDRLLYKAQDLEHTSFFSKGKRAEVESFTEEYAMLSKQIVMLSLLENFFPYIEKIYRDIERKYHTLEQKLIDMEKASECSDLFDYKPVCSHEAHPRKFKLRPDGIQLLEEIVPLKYRPCHDGICVCDGSLIGSGFVDFTKGVTLPCEIDGNPVTEFSGIYDAEKLKHIEAWCVKRVNIKLQGDADMICTPPLLYGGMQDTIESMSLIFEAPTMRYYGDFEGRKDITYIKFSGVVKDNPDWDYGNFERAAFKNCTNLIRIDGIFKGYLLSSDTFKNCTSLVSAPELHVKHIGDYAFQNASSLQSVFIQNGLETIDSSVFEGCSSLMDLYVPDTCLRIGNNTFKNCTSLKTIHLPNCLKEISEGLFYNCESLKKVYLSDSISCIGNNAFYNCKSLENPWIPQSIKRIGANAFYGCVSVKEIVIPEGIEEIGENAFASIPSLIIKGYAGTVAELYASENGITFIALATDVGSPKTDESYDLSRFVEAHKRDFEIALAEIKNGKKITHWMWYIFPQIIGLGKSDIAIKYSIKDIKEAKQFLDDAYLGNNLKKICEALLELNTNDAKLIFGDIDAKKLRSSITLFLSVDENNTLFQKVLDKFFNGIPDHRTLNLLK